MSMNYPFSYYANVYLRHWSIWNWVGLICCEGSAWLLEDRKRDFTHILWKKMKMGKRPWAEISCVAILIPLSLREKHGFTYLYGQHTAGKYLNHYRSSLMCSNNAWFQGPCSACFRMLQTPQFILPPALALTLVLYYHNVGVGGWMDSGSLRHAC